MTVKELRIAFLGVSHWHVPLYFPGLPENSVAAAEKAHSFCAIPFVWRYSDTVAQLKEELLSGKIIHMSYRFIAARLPATWRLPPGCSIRIPRAAAA